MKLTESYAEIEDKASSKHLGQVDQLLHWSDERQFTRSP